MHGPGTGDWQLDNSANNQEIEGYANLTSVNRGGQINFYVNTQDSTYTIEVFRMGWYGGLGGRRETQPVTLPGIAQPMPTPDPVTGEAECNWTSQYTLTVNNPSDPTDWVSGVYLAKLTGLQSGKSSWIIFVVRDDSRSSDLFYQLPMTTFEAYNEWGGASLYDFNSNNDIPAVKVSFNRPFAADRWNGAGDFFDYAYSLLQYVEEQGYDVSYSSSVDTHTSPQLLLQHKGFLSAAHDEYWSWEMRQNITAARDAGVNLGFFGANDIYWQIRFEPSLLTGDANRTIVGYKDSWQQDPMAANPSTYYLITMRWRDDHATLPGLPEDAFIGEMYNGEEPMSVDTVITNASNFIFNGTGLSAGSHLTNLVGYEADRLYFNAPAGTQQVAHSPYIAPDGTLNYSDITYYQAASGASVFATGSMQWNWGLAQGIQDSSYVSTPAQQMMTNMLAQMITVPTPPSVYIGWRSVSTNSTSSANNQLNIGVPTGVAANDILIAQIAVRGGSNTTITPPAGWSLVRQDNQSTTIAQAIYSHAVINASAEPSSYGWSFSSANSAAGGIIDYYGVSNVQPVDASNGQGNASSTNITTPSLVVPAGDNGDLLVSFFSIASATSISLPPPVLPRWSLGASSGGVGIAAADLLLNASGSVAAQTATAGTSSPSVGALIALVPQPAGPTPTTTITATPNFTPTPTSSATPGAGTATATNTPTPAITPIMSPTGTSTPSPTPAASGSPIAMVGSEQRLQGTSGSPITFTARTPNGGDLLAVVCAAVTGPNSILAVTSTTGNNSPFTLAASCANTGGADDEIWYFPGSAAVSTTVKVTPTTTSTYQCALTEWSGVVQSNPIDVLGNCGKSGSGTAINTGSITTTLAGDLILGPLVTTGSNNLNSSLSCGPTTCSGLPTAWNLISNPSSSNTPTLLTDYIISTVPGLFDAQASAIASHGWAGVEVAFQPAQAAAPTPIATATTIPTAAPTATATATGTATATPTATATATGTATAMPTATATATATPTATSTPTATATATPTATSTPTATATATPTATSTPTATATATPTATSTPTATATATPTATSTPTATATATPTATLTPTATATATSTDTPTSTPTATATATSTDTPTATPTATPTDTPTATPTATPTDTPTATATAAPTDTPTATATAAPTNTPDGNGNRCSNRHADGDRNCSADRHADGDRNCCTH